MNITASDAKNKFGQVLLKAQSEPVFIEKNGQPAAVLISMADYAYLEALEDARLAARALEIEKRGKFLGHEESMKILDKYAKKK